MSFIPPSQAKRAPTWMVRALMVFLAAIYTLGAVALLSHREWIGGLVFVALTVLALTVAVVLPKSTPTRRRPKRR